MSRLVAGLLLLMGLALAMPSDLMAQAVDAPPAVESDTSKLDEILARQRGEDVPRLNRESQSDGGSASAQAQALFGTLGSVSDSEIWEDLRFGTADVTTQATGPATTVLVQDRGMWWQEFRSGPLRTYGGYLLLGTLALLALFYLIRGRIRIEGGRSGVTIQRFTSIERFAHWLLAGSFILLGLTGLLLLFGRVAIIPLFDAMGSDAGHRINSVLSIGAKWVHNNVSWAFMLALVMVFFLWVIHNIPGPRDVVWFLKGGGIIGHGHPKAKKFNAGQKLIFWSVIILGGSISASGLSLLFPFELPMFAATFQKLNDFGITALLGLEPLPTTLMPHEEMQFSQLWHAIVSFVLMAIIIAHIYIGSLGMEGAFEAMGDGQVDLKWAREHHSLWVEEIEEKAARSGKSITSPSPAE